MVSVQASRFSLLNVDDDDDSDNNQQHKKVANSKTQEPKSSSKKKNKKKKKLQESKAENDQLRNLAFGTSHARNKARTNSTSSGGKGDASEAQWEQWKKADEEYTAEYFEKDLQDALLQSKIEFEEQKQMKKDLEAAGIILNDDGKQKKKKKQKGTMSLEQFQQMEKVDMPRVKRDDSSEEEVESPAALPPLTHISQPDPQFFHNVDKDVDKIIQKEKIQEEYKKNFVVENARTHQYQEDIRKRDTEIAMLKESHEKLQAELKQVKKRNQQLCHILGQGEMKDKTKILMEVEQLRDVRDELTEEVSQLNSELEKERSKVHQLQAELTKAKGGKHK